VALPFNGIYGFFGNIESKEVADRIIEIKKRPKDRNLIIVSAPEFIDEYVNLTGGSYYSKDSLMSLWRDLHALGVILPAGQKAPFHLRSGSRKETVLSIWTEYPPLRKVMDCFRSLGGKAFVGTSANHSGNAAHFRTHSLWEEFGESVDAIVEADFQKIDKDRHKSTTILDLTNSQPILHRLGNVDKTELKKALKKNLLPSFVESSRLILVQTGE